MRNFILVSFAAIALVGCGQFPAPLPPSKADNISVITYFVHEKTGLCFATQNPQSNAKTLTEVPCTPRVLAVAIVKRND